METRLLAKLIAVLVVLVTAGSSGMAAAQVVVGGRSWCVARSDASQQALQTALDYACGAGADCTPIQQTGLCYLPNTLQAHASYAFNSFFQRKAMAPGSCDFSGTATVAKTDPSYGSCVYPSSPSTAGGTTAPGGGTTTPTTTPILNIPPPPPATFYGNGGNGGLTPVGMGPGILDTPPSSKASVGFTITSILSSVSLFIVLSFIFQPMNVLI